MSTALVVGGWFAQGAIQTLIDKSIDSTIQQVVKHFGFGDDILKLRTSLGKVHFILKITQKKDIAKESLAEPMELLKDAVYDAEDLLDEIDYHALKNKIEHDQEVRNSVSSALVFAGTCLDNTKHKLDVAGRIMKIQRRLDSVAAEIKQFIELLAIDHNQSSRTETEMIDHVINRETTSSLKVLETEVFGRKEEKEKIISYLLNFDGGSTSTRKSISVLVIVGMGGVGKTTLAQLVYNNMKVTKHFQLKMWVCVSVDFNLHKITKAMAESSTKSRQLGFNSLDGIQLILEKNTISKRFC